MHQESCTEEPEPFQDQPCFSTSCHCNCFYPLCMSYRQSKQSVLQWGNDGAQVQHSSTLLTGKDTAAWRIMEAGNEDCPITQFQWLRKGWAITCSLCGCVLPPSKGGKAPVSSPSSHSSEQDAAAHATKHEQSPEVMQLSFFKQ